MNTEEKIKVMQAFVDGKMIQVKTHNNNEWKDFSYDPTQVNLRGQWKGGKQ